ncbi:hypothetical protein [Puniceicoccus vermicola]|uniref:Uncharacterized protein n=1 Tax=Puniceicoccus vermicola TaxID=388746 RepID=A0A7X1B2L1_9BACT|nr:hypothetical protein [Puniceicoccus vermicola]MBC2604392.1 hypothetical protein [Puniceicoccus vermicola]
MERKRDSDFVGYGLAGNQPDDRELEALATLGVRACRVETAFAVPLQSSVLWSGSAIAISSATALLGTSPTIESWKLSLLWGAGVPSRNGFRRSSPNPPFPVAEAR